MDSPPRDTSLPQVGGPTGLSPDPSCHAPIAEAGPRLRPERAGRSAKLRIESWPLLRH